MRIFTLILLLLIAILSSPAHAADPGGEAFFESKVRPLLVEHCYSCHAEGKKVKGGLILDHREGFRKGGESGTAIVPGDPDKSRLIDAVRYKNLDLQMPPKGPLKDAQVRDLETWIRMGAPDPRDASSSPGSSKRTIDIEQGRRFWSFLPLSNPATPAVPNADWVKSPVDSFIAQGLEQAGLDPAPAADKRTLLRRATFDLAGLPPTPAEIEAFLADAAPDAFDRVIERLLASPQYGERWGRHWLDVARYADSNGMDENIAYGHAWRYRDYVVRAFNADKPYDQFLIEQIAGDLLPSHDQSTQIDSLTATGFLAVGAKVLAEPDMRKLEMDIIDEQVDTIGKAFLGMTFGCCRCHDHKFDPVPTADYYALAAIFRGTRSLSDEKMGAIKFGFERSLASPEQLEAKKQHEGKLKEQQAKLATFIKDARAKLKPELRTGKEADVFDAQTLAAIEAMKKETAALQATIPEPPAVMGVADGTVVRSIPIHIRGSYLTLGKEVERGFPEVMRPAGAAGTIFPSKHSGRLELARWMASSEHPLTARVMVNRIWRWHFGRGIVGTVDNFGVLGERPTNLVLLDFLARRFIEEGWSVKAMHRLLMKSSVYQMASRHPAAGTKPPKSDPAMVDPENKLFWRANVRRLEAEEIHDALLMVSGALSLEMGGKTIPLRNREFVFNHTSNDATRYESTRRAVYTPIIRNHLYDVLEQFDYPDPTMPTGSRNSTVVAPQALIMMNAPVVNQSARRLAASLREAAASDDARVRSAYLRLYGRPATDAEVKRALDFLEDQPDQELAWPLLCHTLLAANEFIYLR